MGPFIRVLTCVEYGFNYSGMGMPPVSFSLHACIKFLALHTLATDSWRAEKLERWRQRAHVIVQVLWLWIWVFYWILLGCRFFFRLWGWVVSCFSRSSGNFFSACPEVFPVLWDKLFRVAFLEQSLRSLQAASSDVPESHGASWEGVNTHAYTESFFQDGAAEGQPDTSS